MHKEILSKEQVELLHLLRNFNSTVKLTFFEYPFDIEAPLSLEKIIRMPWLLDLAAMKAYALGRRSKWKDYVDMYFLIKEHFSIVQISERATQIFDQLFSAKLFRAQLSYFDDVNFDEPVEFLVPEPSVSEIKQFLLTGHWK